MTAPFAHYGVPNGQHAPADPYAFATQSADVLRLGAEFRRNRLDAADMVTIDDAAALAGVSRFTINSWIKSRRCIGVANLRLELKLPNWQFEPNLWPLLQLLAAALGAADGWQVLTFLETPAPALEGRTPRAALEQGVPARRILSLATADAY